MRVVSGCDTTDGAEVVVGGLRLVGEGSEVTVASMGAAKVLGREGTGGLFGAVDAEAV